ncbi:phosphoribosyltransferase family protein [Modestobacter sp. NPDC049651]|uniref:phosphoribosyltransferase family protein n=1 Tax=unclassified Modestobacter TaxID=2643866 RepID=UPI0033F8EE3C
MPLFRDRADAGRRLVEPVAALVPADRPLTVVGLPRGGLAVGAALVAGLRALGRTARLEAVAVAKVLAPGDPELALGAVTAHATVRGERACRLSGVDDERFRALAAAARERLADRLTALPPPAAPDGDVLLVDDGLATGATAEAAVAELRATGAGWLGLAVPVADASAWSRVRPAVDGGVALVQRAPLRAVSVDYADFRQLTDAETRAALAAAG